MSVGNPAKRWQWWLVVILLSPLWLTQFLFAATLVVLQVTTSFIDECGHRINESKVNSWLLKFVAWGRGSKWL